MLQLNNLSFAFPGQTGLLANLDLTIPTGHVMAVIGPNGAGKSTLTKLVNGLLKPRNGNVVVDGRDTKGLKVHEIAALVGTLYQTAEEQLFAATVNDEVEFGPAQLKLSEADISQRVSVALERTHLRSLTDKHPLDLCGAERRFTALASVLAMHPKVLLLDEPQRGLDRQWTARLEAIIEAEKEAGTAILLICHDMNFVERHAQSIFSLGGSRPAQQPTHIFFSDHAEKQTSPYRSARQVLSDLLRRASDKPATSLGGDGVTGSNLY